MCALLLKKYTIYVFCHNYHNQHVCGFYEATQRLSCNCTSAELIQFDGRARGDDVMGNLTVSK